MPKAIEYQRSRLAAMPPTTTGRAPVTRSIFDAERSAAPPRFPESSRGGERHEGDIAFSSSGQPYHLSYAAWHYHRSSRRVAALRRAFATRSPAEDDAASFLAAADDTMIDYHMAITSAILATARRLRMMPPISLI